MTAAVVLRSAGEASVYSFSSSRSIWSRYLFTSAAFGTAALGGNPGSIEISPDAAATAASRDLDFHIHRTYITTAPPSTNITNGIIQAVSQKPFCGGSARIRGPYC